MNLSHLIGVILAFVLILFGIVVSDTELGLAINIGAIARFINVQGILITVCGTFGALIGSFPFKFFAKVPKHLAIVMGQKKKNDPIFYINTLTELSQEARKKGLLALEDSVSNFKDDFLKESVMLIVDAMEPDKVRTQLETELDSIESRHAQAWAMYDKGASYAPAFGMLATVIGLINMLSNMNFADSGGAQKLTSDMAMSLITTFYGSMLANVLFMPIASQLRICHEEEMICKQIIIEGIISIQAGENPRHINEKLMGYLTRSQRQAIESSGGRSID